MLQHPADTSAEGSSEENRFCTSEPAAIPPLPFYHAAEVERSSGVRAALIMRWAFFIVSFSWYGCAGAVLSPLGVHRATATPSYHRQETPTSPRRRCLPPLTMSIEEEQRETSDNSSAYLSGTKLTREQVGWLLGSMWLNASSLVFDRDREQSKDC